MRILCVGVASFAVAASAACTGAPKTSEASPPSFTDLLVGENAGPLLARAYREHSATPDENRIALVAMTSLIRTASTGTVDPLLLNTNVVAALQRIAARYPSLSVQSPSARLRAAPEPSARSPRWSAQDTRTAPSSPEALAGNTCDGSCFPSSDRVLRTAARLTSQLTPARTITEAGALARLWFKLTSRTDIGTVAAEVIGAEVAAQMTDAEVLAELDVIGRKVIPGAALIQFFADAGLIASGGALVPFAAGFAATLVALGTVYALGTQLNEASSAYVACTDWKATHCRCGGVALLPGNTCCADGTQATGCCSQTSLVPGNMCCSDGTQAPACCSETSLRAGNECCTNGTQVSPGQCGATTCGPLGVLPEGGICCGTGSKEWSLLTRTCPSKGTCADILPYSSGYQYLFMFGRIIYSESGPCGPASSDLFPDGLLDSFAVKFGPRDTVNGEPNSLLRYTDASLDTSTCALSASSSGPVVWFATQRRAAWSRLSVKVTPMTFLNANGDEVSVLTGFGTEERGCDASDATGASPSGSQRTIIEYAAWP